MGIFGHTRIGMRGQWMQHAATLLWVFVSFSLLKLQSNQAKYDFHMNNILIP